MANPNLVFLERFNTDLSNWTLDQSGGTVSIVTQDYSAKLKLNDSNASAAVSAVRSFAAPSSKYIVEYDMMHATGSVGVCELLAADNTPIITVDIGSTSETISFSTDTASASTAVVNIGIYKEIMLVIDPAANTVSCYMTMGKDGVRLHGDIDQIGAAKSFSGVVIAKIRFRTAQSQTGIVYVDEVKAYISDIFLIGDSISDGKSYWSHDPDFSSRKAAIEDETSPPHYQIGLKLGSNLWVANRAFGGSTLAGIDINLQKMVIGQGAKKVIVCAGHNDLYYAYSISAMQASMNSIISQLQSANITGQNIIVGNIIPSAFLDTDLERSKKEAWNNWLLYRSIEIGAAYVDLNRILKDPADANAINPLYRDTDAVHLIPAGNVVWAQTVRDAIIGAEYLNANILRVASVFDEVLYPQGYIVGEGRGAYFNNINAIGGFRVCPAM